MNLLSKLLIIFLFVYGIGNFAQNVFATPSDASISASSTNCVMPCSGVTITWSVQGVEFEAKVIRGSETVGTGSSGTASPSINLGSNTFNLRADGQTVASVTVNATNVAPTAVPTVTPTPVIVDYRSCNQSCGGANQQCVTGLTCHNGVCRLPSNTGDPSCSVPSHNSSSTSSTTSTSSPTATPRPQSGSTGSTSTNLAANSTGETTSDEPVIEGEATAEQDILGAETEATPTVSIEPTPKPQNEKGFMSNPAVKVVTLSTMGLISAGLLGIGLQALGVINVGAFAWIIKKLVG